MQVEVPEMRRLMLTIRKQGLAEWSRRQEAGPGKQVRYMLTALARP